MEEQSIKKSFEQKVTNLLAYLMLGMVLSVYPIFGLFRWLEWITTTDFLIFVAVTVIVVSLIFIIKFYWIEKESAKYLITSLLFTMPLPIWYALDSTVTIWSVVFLYLIIAMLYMDRKVLLLATLLGLINLALLIILNWTVKSTILCKSVAQ